MNSLAVLHEMNGYMEKSREKSIDFYFGTFFTYCFAEESAEKVNQICADYNIDLDEDSETPASQSRNEACDFDDEIDLDDIIGTYQTLLQLTFLILLFSLNRRRQRRRVRVIG